MGLLPLLLSLAAWAGTPMAVLPFDNNSGNASYDALGTGLADMMVTDLAKVEEIELVERSRIREILSEIELGDDGYLDPDTAAKAGKGVGAKYMLVGAIVAIDPVLRIDARVVEVKSGRIRYTASAEGDRTEFFLVEKDLVLGVLDEMGIAVSAREAAKVGRVATESFDAFVAYSEGLEQLDQGEVEAARRRFEAAVQADSGFSAANSAIDDLREQLSRIQEARDSAMSEQTQQALQTVADYAAGKVDDETLLMLAQSSAINLHNLKPSEALRLCRAFIELGLPEDMVYGEPPYQQSVNEWAMASIVLMAGILHDRTEVLTWGQAFVERYPTSRWFQSVQITLDRHLKNAEREKEAKASGEIEKIRDKHYDQMLEQRCDDEPDVRKVLAQCEAWIAWKDQKGRPLEWRDLDDVFYAAEDIGDVDTMRAVRERWEKEGFEPTKLESLDSTIEGMARQFERADAATEDLKFRKDDRYDAGDMRSDVRDLLRVGRFAQVEEGLQRMMREHPNDEDTFKTRWRVAKTLGDIDEMRVILKDAIAAGVKIDSSRDREEDQIEDVWEDRWATDMAEADMYEDLRNAFSGVQLHRLAAEAQQHIVDDFPEWPRRERADMLHTAAQRWSSVDDPEALRRATALYEQVIREFPDSNQARRAQDWLSRAPK